MKFLWLALFLSVSAFAGQEGGGGDATEVRVNEIRSDLLSWIKKGGARELDLPSHISYDEYADKMSEILKPKKVIIGFNTKKVSVKKVEKTCKGYIDQVNSKPHILCNIARFEKTSDSNQYKLIHHEYAGLVNLENNDGASSDYSISIQLTDFLTEQPVLKLAIKKNDSKKEEEITDCADFVKKKRLLLKDVQKLTGEKSYLEVLSSYADSLQSQVVSESKEGKISHEEAQSKSDYIVGVRQCANFLGMVAFE
jgi:hypothetical protein